MQSLVYPIAAVVLSVVFFGSEIASADPTSDSELATEWSGAPDAYGVFAQAETDDVERKPLEPTYEPREPEPKPWYNSDYLFGMTRGVANSTIAPAGKVPLFVLTVPLDIVFLPFAAIGGLFG